MERRGRKKFLKHLVVESHFKQIKDVAAAHEAAHILERYISEEVLNKVEKLSTFRG